MLKNAEDRFKDEHSRDGSGTVTRVSKQREERTVVLRYTGAGTGVQHDTEVEERYNAHAPNASTCL